MPMVDPIAATQMQLDIALESQGLHLYGRIPEIRAVSLMKDSGSLDPEGVAFGGSQMIGSEKTLCPYEMEQSFRHPRVVKTSSSFRPISVVAS